MATPHQALGAYGEELATTHLRQLGYEIIMRNWQCRAGEIDIIARDANEWVFVEVRTRRAPDTDSAIESVTPAKEARVLAASQTYLDAHDLVYTGCGCRVQIGLSRVQEIAATPGRTATSFFETGRE